LSNPLDSRGIPPGAIKDRQVSKTAKLDPGKLKPVDPGQILVGQDTKKLAAQTVSGDATIAPDGTLTLNSASVEGEVKKVLQNLNIEEGAQANMKPSAIKKLYEELPEVKAFTPEYSRMLKYADSDNVGESLVKRDAGGNIKVETVTGSLSGNAATASDAALLNGNNMAYYRNVANHVAETATTSTDNNNNDISHQKTPHKVFEFEVPSDSLNYSSGAPGTSTSNYPIEFTHNCGYIPDVSVYYKSNNAQTSDPWEEVDAEVQNTTTTTKVQISAQNAHLKIVAK